jgi:hypothetical protein
MSKVPTYSLASRENSSTHYAVAAPPNDLQAPKCLGEWLELARARYYGSEIRACTTDRVRAAGPSRSASRGLRYATDNFDLINSILLLRELSCYPMHGCECPALPLIFCQSTPLTVVRSFRTMPKSSMRLCESRAHRKRARATTRVL